MIGLVRLALRRPYTMAIAGLLILLMGFLSAQRMVVDIFPNIDIPVVYVAWNYPGLSAEDMERRVVLISERAYSTTVNGIERIESLSIPGLGILKVYFTQGTDIGGAIAQINAQNNSILRIAPPGITPPNMIRFNASNVPVVQVTLNSRSLPEQQIFDYGLNFLRTRLFTIPGLSIPAPYGGKQRQIIVDVDPARLSSKGLSQMDVVSALQTTNVIVPAGIARIGEREFNVKLNSSPQFVEQFQALPVGVRDGIAVMLGDVANVSDSFATQQNAVRINGQRASYMSILKNSDASTIAVVQAIRDVLPDIQATAPEGLDLKLDFDQSVFVQGAVDNIVHEAILSSILVSLMILIFLGSWRNTVIVSLSIPLSIAAGVAGLFLTGQTINLMTLGGLALAIGLLVDNATVTIENIHRNQTLGKPLTVAILDGSSEVIQPLTVATLAICIVFFPVLLLTGPSRFLFIPLAITVVLAMLASYVLSFTVIPALARYLLKDHDDHAPKGIGGRFSAAFDRGFERVKNGYGNLLAVVLARRGFVLGCFGLVIVMTGMLAPVIGTDFFPTSDVGILKMHIRAARGMRLEETEKIVARVEESIRQMIPAKELRTINATIGLPFSLNLAFVPSDNTSGMDAELLISLNHGHKPTVEYQRLLRDKLNAEFPGNLFYFQTADIVSQVLNFGLSAPIDIQIQDSNFVRAYATAQRILRSIQKVPGVVDPRIAQVLDFPTIQIDVDRQRAARLGVAQRDVANNMLTSLAGSALVGPTYYLNPQTGVNYIVAVQTPADKISTVQDVMNLPANPAAPNINPNIQPTTLTTVPASPVTRISDIASMRPTTSMQSINHYTVQRVVDVLANVDSRDLGGTAADIKKIIEEEQKNLPSTVKLFLRGQNEVMETSFKNLGFGLILAILLVYALLVVLFQSWVDPFIIMMAVPGALVGILWTLAMTGTTINVASLMGSIMSVGIAVSNSILVVSFANDLRSRNDSLTPIEAVIEAGKTRLRPILMTALAMIIGMIPMALALGEAGEQNAPLGRAVIGGLAFATIATLVLVPVFYTLLRRQPPSLHMLDKRFEAEASGASTGGSAHA
ncbi:efflux RND transporter permease subunit [Rhodoplanes sp. Z2-YC6860]|uniref:efflux RND transporter permease subunit n=1 Tax=Rhodoplanes sp. Z2-YC6860 TaxID=674703 RepID=UPI00078B978E|nr:efflux RND transporter permease subunit [Rhodoplanes sp. Z2-YC6860]AMN41815.1 acriflavin resistance protein [Rhodoplanes sp. Z2-YC6860]